MKPVTPVPGQSVEIEAATEAAALLRSRPEFALAIACRALKNARSTGDRPAIERAKQVSRLVRRYRVVQRIGHYFIVAGLCAIAAAPCIIVYQLIRWLRTADWQAIPLSLPLYSARLLDPYAVYQIEWRELATIVELVLNLPATGVLFVAGAGLAAIGASLFEKVPKER